MTVAVAIFGFYFYFWVSNYYSVLAGNRGDGLGDGGVGEMSIAMVRL